MAADALATMILTKFNRDNSDVKGFNMKMLLH